MYTVLIKNLHNSSINATYPSLFAKSSFLWPALFAIFGDREIRKVIKKNFFCSSIMLCNDESSLRIRTETRRVRTSCRVRTREHEL